MWRATRLRGCIGTFDATDDVVATTSAMTRASLDDRRFVKAPVTLEELRDITIEISILSEATATKRPMSLVPGTHGVIVRRRGRSGCFLPKVCSERGWSAEEFLSNCCTMKADLPADAWRKPDTSVWLFTAQVFSENQLAKNATGEQ
ncbi:MAG: AmmeMemoRadiSam system protein A [Planctomycetes bacterium]|nr:AmmeMemoRadiSam system protein A [Planctomycetota bacterium]